MKSTVSFYNVRTVLNTARVFLSENCLKKKKVQYLKESRCTVTRCPVTDLHGVDVKFSALLGQVGSEVVAGTT